MSTLRVLWIGCSALLVAPVCWAGSGMPVAVSPGTPTGALIGDICPTFNWGAVPDADSYELVVYQVGEEGEVARAVLRRRISGAANGWTPALDQCLERGGQYAWSVRAVGSNATSNWAPPSLFEVASGPSEAEFEEALTVVRAYIAQRHEPTVEVSDEIEDRSQSEDRQNTEANSPSPRAPPPTALSVDGNVDATSFTGDGSTLTGVNATTLDGVDSLSFLRSNTSDSFTSGTLTMNSGTSLDVKGTLLMPGIVSKTGTSVVTNFNADLLDGLHEPAFFRLSQNETVSGRPAFNGGTSGSTAPFTVDSNTHVTNLNADFLDGFNGSNFLRPSSPSYGCGSYKQATFCPGGGQNGPPCDEVPAGSWCETDGECSLNDNLDNCPGLFDWYFKYLN